MIMQTETLILILAATIAVLVMLVVFLVWHMSRKDSELHEKDQVIIREVRRNQTLIDRAVQHGVSRAAMLL